MTGYKYVLLLSSLLWRDIFCHSVERTSARTTLDVHLPCWGLVLCPFHNQCNNSCSDSVNALTAIFESEYNNVVCEVPMFSFCLGINVFNGYRYVRTCLWLVADQCIIPFIAIPPGAHIAIRLTYLLSVTGVFITERETYDLTLQVSRNKRNPGLSASSVPAWTSVCEQECWNTAIDSPITLHKYLHLLLYLRSHLYIYMHIHTRIHTQIHITIYIRGWQFNGEQDWFQINKWL